MFFPLNHRPAPNWPARFLSSGSAISSSIEGVAPPDCIRFIMLATFGFDISLSIPPLAIICCAICIIMGLFMRLARSGMPPAPPAPPIPPMLRNMSAIPPSPAAPAPGPARVFDNGMSPSGTRGGGPSSSSSSEGMRSKAFCKPDFRLAFVGSSSTPFLNAAAAAL